MDTAINVANFYGNAGYHYVRFFDEEPNNIDIYQWLW